MTFIFTGDFQSIEIQRDTVFKLMQITPISETDDSQHSI